MDGIKRIRKRTGFCHVIFVGSLDVLLKTVEAWENGRNKTEGTVLRLLKVACADQISLYNEFRCRLYGKK